MTARFGCKMEARSHFNLGTQSAMGGAPPSPELEKAI
jgi:hypothetical protein